MNKLESKKALSARFPQIEDDLPFVKLEKGLISIGYFSVPKYREGKRNPLQEKIVKVLNLTEHGIEGRAEILTHRRYGLPTISDLTKYLAFLKIVHDKYKGKSHIANPIEFTHYELLQKAGIKRNPSRYREVTEWIQRLNNTQILLGGKLGDPKIHKDSGIHIFEKFTIRGTIGENGEEIKHNQVWLSAWAIKNICELPLVPIDFETYRKLKNDTAKLIVAHLQVWLYGSKDSHIFQKTYTEFAQLLGIKEWRHKAKIIEQLENAFNELQHYEYISNWRIAEAASGYKIMLWHGKKFHRDLKRAFFVVEPPKITLPEKVALNVNRLTAAAAAAERTDGANNIFEYLQSFGMFGELVEKLLEKFEIEVLTRRAKWAVGILDDTEQREKVLNKGGFLYKLINSDDAVPEDFRLLEEVNQENAEKGGIPEHDMPRLPQDDGQMKRYERFCCEQAAKTPRFSFTEYQKRLQAQQNLWKELLELIAAELNPQIFNAWFNSPVCAGFDDADKTIFLLADQFTCQWLEQNYTDFMNRILADSRLTGYRIKCLPVQDQPAAELSDRWFYDQIMSNDYRDRDDAVTFEEFSAENLAG